MSASVSEINFFDPETNDCPYPAYHQLREEAPVWLDPYGASAPDEFFAVASEAYFVNPQRFASEFPTLMPMFDAFFGASRASTALRTN